MCPVLVWISDFFPWCLRSRCLPSHSAAFLFSLLAWIVSQGSRSPKEHCWGIYCDSRGAHLEDFIGRAGWGRRRWRRWNLDAMNSLKSIHVCLSLEVQKPPGLGDVKFTGWISDVQAQNTWKHHRTTVNISSDPHRFELPVFKGQSGTIPLVTESHSRPFLCMGLTWSHAIVRYPNQTVRKQSSHMTMAMKSDVTNAVSPK